MEKIKFVGTGGSYTAFNRKGERLGKIYFLHSWRDWVWEQEPDVIMLADWLIQVFVFIEHQRMLRKELKVRIKETTELEQHAIETGNASLLMGRRGDPYGS